MINIDSRVKENVETKIKKDSSDRYKKSLKKIVLN